MALTRTQWDPAKHPRGPLGRFVDVSGGGPGGWRHNPDPDIADYQRGLWVDRPNRYGDERAELLEIYASGEALTDAGVLPTELGQKVLADYADNPGINRILRAGRTPSATDQFDNPWDVSQTFGPGRVDAPTEAEYVRELDEAIETNQLRRDTLLYRAGRTDMYHERTGEEVESPWAKLQPGDQIYDPAYMSTALDPTVTEEFGDIRMEIEAPAGTHVATPSLFGNQVFEDQTEMLFGRGSVLEITERWEPPGEGITRIRARLVGYMGD